MHVSLIQIRWKQLGIAATTVDVLFMLYSELKNKILSLIAELVKFGRYAIETGILACLQTWKFKYYFYIETGILAGLQTWKFKYYFYLF